METNKTITIPKYFLYSCIEVVNGYNRKLNLDFHNYILEMHSTLVKGKSIYGMFSNDPIKRTKPKDFLEFKGKLLGCAYVYYHAEFNYFGRRPTLEELNKKFWLEKTHIEMINEINNLKKQMVFNPDFEIMQCI